VSSVVGDPVKFAVTLRPIGWVFAVWNGWALVLMARARTALLPAGETAQLLDRGPFRVSRNPVGSQNLGSVPELRVCRRLWVGGAQTGGHDLVADVHADSACGGSDGAAAAGGCGQGRRATGPAP
jgi:hypothetical protein